jgi:hypothetical protein
MLAQSSGRRALGAPRAIDCNQAVLFDAATAAAAGPAITANSERSTRRWDARCLLVLQVSVPDGNWKSKGPLGAQIRAPQRVCYLNRVTAAAAVHRAQGLP